MKPTDFLHFSSSKDPRGFVLDSIDGTEWAAFCARHSEEWRTFARTHVDPHDEEKWEIFHDGGYWSVWGGDYGVCADGIEPVPVIRGKSPPDPEVPRMDPEFVHSARKEVMDNYIKSIKETLSQSTGVEIVHPLKHKTLYLQLANADTPEKLKQFVDAHGLPFNMHNNWKQEEQVSWAPVSALEAWRDNIRDAIRFDEIDQWDLGDGAPIPISFFQAEGPNITAGFIHDEENYPRFRFQPNSLANAVWCQLGIDIEAGVRLKRCPHCNSVFGIGKGTYHRSTAVFCSPKCQNAAAYARRKAKILK